MKVFAVLMGAALLTTACSDSNRSDLAYDRRDVRDDQRSIDATVEERKEIIDANARYEKERLEAEAAAQKKILEAEREKAAALNRASDRRADEVEDINDDPAGAELRVRGDWDDDDDIRLRSSLDLDNNRDVTVNMSGGTLTLRGTVNSQAQKIDMEARAKSFPGVTRVDNQLRVR